MSDAFFKDLKLPRPDFHLGVGSGSHAQQTGGVMIAYEAVCAENPPDWIVVVGDVNSTIACAMVGAKLCVRVAHLEAGLRSRNRSMPEEINRILTDSISDLLWTPSADANENLIAEGVDEDRIELVGNIMIDSYEMLREQINTAGTAGKLGLADRRYGVVTLHRPSNVDKKSTLQGLLEQLAELAAEVPLVFTVHPRTQKSIDRFRLQPIVNRAKGLTCVTPMGYVEFMSLVQDSIMVLTDSGGVQEETTYLGIPCVTVRPETERPVTVDIGTNQLAKPEEIGEIARRILAGQSKASSVPELWDGHTAQRVAKSLEKRSQLEGLL
jgi:UDP-N-acetylglucosamine 2-epimerase (non-hydrolysing)